MAAACWVRCFAMGWVAALAISSELVRLDSRLSAVDADGDGVLDTNLLVLREGGGEVEDILRAVVENESTGDHVKIGVMDDGVDGFKAMFEGTDKDGNPVVDNDEIDGPWDVVFIKRGTEVEHANTLFNGFLQLEGESVTDQLHFFFIEVCMRLDVGWVNFLDEPFDLFWVDTFTKEEHNIGLVEIGEPKTVWRLSYIGHTFLLRGQNSGREETFTADTDRLFRLGEFPSLVGSRADPGQHEYDNLKASELKRSDRIKRAFTDVGFKRIKTPRKLWADIRRWWHVNRESSFVEDWHGKGIYVNWWKKDAKMCPPPHRMKERWHMWFQPVLEEWSGVELEKTDLYGIRTYHRGAELQSHVDREATHAVSAIINVESPPDLEEDWQLEFYDVNGKQGWYSMSQGDSMLYESALCLHGRPRPLKGAYYANVFFHYRPVGNPRWYLGDESQGDDYGEEEPQGLHPDVEYYQALMMGELDDYYDEEDEGEGVKEL